MNELGNDGEKGQCLYDGDFEPPRPLAAILRDVKRANSPATKVANSPQPKGCNSPTHLLPLQFFDYCLTAPTTAHAGGMAAISRGLFPAGNNS